MPPYSAKCVTSVHALLSGLAIRAGSFVLISQNTQHILEGEGWVQTDTCVVSCRQFETHVLSVSSLGATYTVLGVSNIRKREVLPLLARLCYVGGYTYMRKIHPW